MNCELCENKHCIMCDERLGLEHFLTEACTIRNMICTKTYKAGETIFRKDEPSTYLYILKSGRVKLTSAMPSGRNQIVGLITPGQMLGVDTLSDEFYPYSATARSTTTVCRFKHAAMMNILNEHPCITTHLLDDLNTKLSQTRALIEAIGRKTAIEKIAACILSIQPQDRPDVENHPLQLSRKEIAEMLGLTEETISRVVTELRRRGVIDTSRSKIILLDRELLQEIADDTPTSKSKSPKCSAA